MLFVHASPTCQYVNTLDDGICTLLKEEESHTRDLSHQSPTIFLPSHMFTIFSLSSRTLPWKVFSLLFFVAEVTLSFQIENPFFDFFVQDIIKSRWIVASRDVNDGFKIIVSKDS